MYLRKYHGTTYIGIVGPTNESGESRDSINNIARRAGDGIPHPIRATKGYEARQEHLNIFEHKTTHESILLLDHDNKFPPDTLERLRSHQLSFVSGFYLRRRYNPLAPVWFHDNPANEWPYEPYLADPEKGKLAKLGASGWGCMFMHREVLEGVKPILKGEDYVIEDDMDIWPYDLNKVMAALKTADIDTLRQEIRPLRGTHDVVGSDLRFPFFAKQAGFQLWGDPDVRVGHILEYSLHPDDFSLQDDTEEHAQKNRARVLEGRQTWAKRMRALA